MVRSQEILKKKNIIIKNFGIAKAVVNSGVIITNLRTLIAHLRDRKRERGSTTMEGGGRKSAGSNLSQIGRVERKNILLTRF